MVILIDVGVYFIEVMFKITHIKIHVDKPWALHIINVDAFFHKCNLEEGICYALPKGVLEYGFEGKILFLRDA